VTEDRVHEMFVTRMYICSESEGSDGSDDTRGEEGGGGVFQGGDGFCGLLKSENSRGISQILSADDGG